MIALWSAVTIPLLGGETGVGLAAGYQGLHATRHQVLLLKFQVIIPIVMICIVE